MISRNTERISAERTTNERLRVSTVKDIKKYQVQEGIHSFPTAAKIIVDKGLKKKSRKTSFPELPEIL